MVLEAGAEFKADDLNEAIQFAPTAFVFKLIQYGALPNVVEKLCKNCFINFNQTVFYFLKFPNESGYSINQL